jgi:5-methylcytosine-specific restriction endonuclease McrA
MEYIWYILFVAIILAIKYWLRYLGREKRRETYGDYIKSDSWQRKRYLVLKRDNYTCVYCGAKATQVHHKKYAKYNIGREPIEWLVSVCDNCHQKEHKKLFKYL